MNDGDKVLRVLRRCARCWEWLDVGHFLSLGKVCQYCMHGTVPVDTFCLMRAIVLTDKGRAALREMREAAA